MLLMKRVLKPAHAVALFSQIILLSLTVNAQTNTYIATRKLLLKAETDPINKQFKKLFQEADVRMLDLIQALDDADSKVSLNSQRVLDFLAAPQGLAAVEAWCKRQRAQYSTPGIEQLQKVKILDGNSSDPEQIARKNFSLLKAGRYGTKDLSVAQIVYNKTFKTALIEIEQGNYFTTGWHIVIRKESGKWWLISENLAWDS
jgi:hypothetical protein